MTAGGAADPARVTSRDALQSLRRSARALAETHVAPVAERLDAEERFSWDVVDAYRAAGLLAFMVPESFGGAGGTIMGETVIAEELARVDVATTMVFTLQSVCATIFDYIGSEDQRRHYLPRIVKGELLAVALTEPGAGSDAAAILTTARKVPGGYVLDGTKHFCTNGDVADIILVFAVTAPGRRHRGISVFAVERPSPGLTITRHDKKMGLHASATVEFVLEQCFAPDSARLGPENEGFTAAMYALERGRVAIGGVAVGLAQGAMEQAVAYARQREQPGQPVGASQGIQFMLADMATEIEAARRLVYHAGDLAERRASDFRAVSAKAKCFATDVAMRVTTNAVQIFGDAGYISGRPVERMMRDAKVLQIFEGTNQLMRVLVARDLLR